MSSEKNDKVADNDFVNKITLDYLVNGKNKDKVVFKFEKKVSVVDKRFYKKRVLQVVKDLLNKDSCFLEMSCDVDKSFNAFLYECVSLLKMIDKRDIMQEEYKDFDKLAEENENLELEPNFNKIDFNKNNELLFKKSNVPKTTCLDNFVSFKENDAECSKTISFPMKKKINLKNPELKVKGLEKICKKKNITNIISENNETIKENESKSKDLESKDLESKDLESKDLESKDLESKDLEETIKNNQ